MTIESNVNYCHQKNNAIETMRFFFTCIICLWHFRSIATFIHNGYIGVEFFFILSGFFLYISYISHPDLGTIDFTLNKIKRFYPPLLISIFLLILLDRKQYLYISDFSPDGILNKYFTHVHEVFFCQGLGLTEIYDINGPIWFISILLLAGAFLYSLLRNYNHFAISIIIPAISFWGISYLLQNGTHSFANSTHIPGFYSRCVRGVSEMGIGILLAYVLNRKEFLFRKYKKFIGLSAAISLLGIVLIVSANGNYDYLLLFFIPLILSSCIIKDSLLQKVFYHNFWRRFGDISMYMYFIHYFVASVFFIIIGRYNLHFEKYVLLTASVYICAVMLAASILRFVSLKILNKI